MHIGIATRCLNKEAKCPEQYAHEYYLLDCKKKTFSCNTYSTAYKDWSRKIKKGDTLVFWMLNSTFYFMHNDKELVKISCPRFGHTDFFLTAMMWPQNMVKIKSYEPFTSKNIPQGLNIGFKPLSAVYFLPSQIQVNNNSK